jgi:glycosyltransferase involved in cell wall biosynthesis
VESLVSVVIPTYNRASDLKRALKSVLDQTYFNWEVLVIDNYSTDGTNELISEFNDVRIKLFKINNQGVIAVSRNLGIRLSSGEYIAFLDSDDFWLPKKLEISLIFLQQGADIVYHDLYLFRKKEQYFFIRKAKTRVLATPVYDNLLAKGNALNNSSVVVKRDLLFRINLFSEDKGLIAMEDYDAWLKISKFTNKFTQIPETLGYYWIGGGNTSNPELTLKNLDYFEIKYKDSITELKLYKDIYWLSYVRGKQNYLLGKHQLALLNYKKLVLMESGIYYKVIALVMIYFITFLSISKKIIKLTR